MSFEHDAGNQEPTQPQAGGSFERVHIPEGSYSFRIVGREETRSKSRNPMVVVDLMVVGALTFADVAAATGGCEQQLGREVNPTVYPPAEYREKLEAGHHFLETVRDGEKIFLIGDQHDLARLAEGGSAEKP